jgi:hypothetical protein
MSSTWITTSGDVGGDEMLARAVGVRTIRF